MHRTLALAVPQNAVNDFAHATLVTYVYNRGNGLRPTDLAEPLSGTHNRPAPP